MTTIEPYILPVVSILMILTLLIFVWIATRSLKAHLHEDGQYKISYCIYVITLLCGGTFFISKGINWINQSLIIINKLPNHNVWSLLKSLLIFDAVSLFSLFFSLYFSTLLFKAFFNRVNQMEIELDQDAIGYFIIRGVLFVVCSWCFLPLFEQILWLFKPDTGIMMYH